MCKIIRQYKRYLRTFCILIFAISPPSIACSNNLIDRSKYVVFQEHSSLSTTTVSMFPELSRRREKNPDRRLTAQNGLSPIGFSKLKKPHQFEHSFEPAMLAIRLIAAYQ
jgi:hypothetical protein